jgi:EAL domain-containing protein (putative c-di-GMP-specific phosphodiesterase class I)/GGDEF domain-containing protein
VATKPQHRHKTPDSTKETQDLDQLLKQSDKRLAELEVENRQLREEAQELKAQRQDLQVQCMELEHLINQNPSTGLPIRRLFESDVDGLLSETKSSRRSPRVAIGFLRLDEHYTKIKNVRDRSHLLLTRSAERIRSVVGNNVYQSDRLDEFLIIFRNMPNLDAVGLSSNDRVGLGMMDRIVDTLSQPHEPPADDISFGCYLGIAIYPHHGESRERLMHHADIALMESERRGDPYVIYDDSMGVAYDERTNLETELKLSIQRGRFEQFQLQYQPLVDKTEQIVGSEALIRWESPTTGAIKPDRFIPIAEQTGTIRYLDLWTLYRAAGQLRTWRRSGHDLFMSVNLSPAQFKQPELVTQIRSMLRSLSLDGTSIKLEITEGIIMDDPEQAIDKMNQLTDLGVSLALDDFGTGYSSLGYLRRFPIETLKIDRSFVADVHLNNGNREIIKAMIAMARGFGMQVLAEGVEKREELDLLLELGCDLVQGYYYSEPVYEDSFVDLLTKGLLQQSDS